MNGIEKYVILGDKHYSIEYLGDYQVKVSISGKRTPIVFDKNNWVVENTNDLLSFPDLLFLEEICKDIIEENLKSKHKLLNLESFGAM